MGHNGWGRFDGNDGKLCGHEAAEWWRADWAKWDDC